MISAPRQTLSPVQHRPRTPSLLNKSTGLIVFCAVLIVVATCSQQDSPTADRDGTRLRPLTEEESRRAETILKLEDITSSALLRQKGTPQNRAMEWLIETDTRRLDAEDPSLPQRFILALLWFSTSGVRWKHTELEWLSGEEECNWVASVRNAGKIGVLQCNDNKEVTHLHLVENELEGSIPSEMRHLSSLAYLDLQNNALGGEIPEQLGYLASIRFLSLASNQLSGKVPLTLGGLDSLEDLFLQGNRFEGPVPESLCRLRKVGLFGNFWTDCLREEFDCSCCTVCCNETCDPVKKRK